MDEIDRKIIEILKKNGRATYTDIGKKVKLSEGAVRKRVKNLVSSGVIERFTVQIALSKSAKAITLISADPSSPTSKVSDKLSEIKHVETVYEVTGQYDIAVIISALNISEVNKCVEQIRRRNAVANTNTMIILRRR